MVKIRVTKQFGFEMSHALTNYDGLCRNIHGHSYKLQITVIGEPLSEPGNPKDGMVVDFSILKTIVKEHIVDRFDHSLMVNNVQAHDKLIELGEMYERHHMVNFQPTSENMVIYIAEKMKKVLPKQLELHSIRLYETSTSYAEWFASDNL